MSKKTRTLLFLKSSGVLIGEITEETDRSVIDLSQFYVKEVEFDESLEQYWYGDYTSGEVRSRVEKPVIAESTVKYSTNAKIITKYPIHKQINIILDMLDNSNLEKTPEFIELKNYLDTEIQKHRDKVKTFASNSDAYVWISSEDEENEYSKKVI